MFGGLSKQKQAVCETEGGFEVKGDEVQGREKSTGHE